jgi:acetolactate synthase-1/2/3 large subunit
LATARENDLPVAVLVMNDSALGMVLQWQRMLYDNRLCSVDLGRVPDFVKIAEAYGCHGVRVERASEISRALAEAQLADRPTVIDVPVDPRENVLPFLPPGKSSRDVVLGPRCIWKGGEAPEGRCPPAA